MSALFKIRYLTYTFGVCTVYWYLDIPKYSVSDGIQYTINVF